MNLDKMISKLQSRIAKRRPLIKACWDDWNGLHCLMDKDCAIMFGEDQKLDKQLLQQLYYDKYIEKSTRESGL